MLFFFKGFFCVDFFLGFIFIFRQCTIPLAVMASFDFTFDFLLGKDSLSGSGVAATEEGRACGLAHLNQDDSIDDAPSSPLSSHGDNCRLTSDPYEEGVTASGDYVAAPISPVNGLWTPMSPRAVSPISINSEAESGEEVDNNTVETRTVFPSHPCVLSATCADCVGLKKDVAHLRDRNQKLKRKNQVAVVQAHRWRSRCMKLKKECTSLLERQHQYEAAMIRKLTPHPPTHPPPLNLLRKAQEAESSNCILGHVPMAVSQMGSKECPIGMAIKVVMAKRSAKEKVRAYSLACGGGT